ncbi:MAG: hypothetical protein ACTHML_14715 [Ginsengibacter sp.]
MRPKVVHQEAMDYSFKAKQALEKNLFAEAFEHYLKAAELESNVAKFYLDKPELEPTRSIVIRSAAFLNIKAGQIEKAKEFIFFGLLNLKDKLIINQLNDALEVAISLGNMDTRTVSKEFNYLNLLRQRSIHYILEPANPTFGHSVRLEAIKDFAGDYLKSLKAYAESKFKQLLNTTTGIEQSIKNEIDQIVNPLVTSSAYGSFKFSIANDFLLRIDESKETLELKSNIVSRYHKEIFTNPLNDTDINTIKSTYSEEEVNDIFRPLAKIKSPNTPYKVGYYDSYDFKKTFVGNIVNKQRQKLLTVKPPSQEDIGELENLITHKRSSQDGKVHKTTIFKQQMKSAEFNFKTNQIDPTEHASLILTEEIIVDINFNSNTGFTVSYPDFRVENTDTAYGKAVKGFYDKFYLKLKSLANKQEKNDEEEVDWQVGRKLLGNPEALKFS